MTIPDEAVRSAPERIWTCNETKNIWIGEKQEDTVEYVRADLAIPFLQGVKVKALNWVKPPLSETLSRCETEFGTYRTWTHSEANGKWFWSVEGGFNNKNGDVANEEAAKAAAQADYEARILSAIEPAPSPRAQALEEAAKVAEQYDPTDTLTAPKEIAAAIRALSSQPVAVRLPTHRHKKRGTDYVLMGIGKMQAENWQVSKDGFDQSIDMEEVAIYRSVDDGAIWVRPRSEFEDSRFEALPASPGASG